MSEVRTAISSAVSSAARPPERTHAPVCTCLRTDVSQTCRVEAGEPPAMMLVGLAEHNQPQRESEPDLGPSFTSLAANKLLPPARSTACTRLLSAVCLCLRRLFLAAAPPPPPPPTLTPARHIAFLPRILSALNNNRLAFPNQSHARDNNLRTDSWSRIQLHISARIV